MSRDIQQKGAAKHFAQIFRTWEGVPLTRRRYDITKDPRGKIIKKDQTDTSLIGVISAISLNPKLRGAGWVSEDNSVGFFQGIDFEVGDHIIWDGQGEYELIQIMGRIFDVEEGVASTVELVMVPK